jgi:hypothetical protein
MFGRIVVLAKRQTPIKSITVSVHTKIFNLLQLQQFFMSDLEKIYTAPGASGESHCKYWYL